MNGLEHVGGGQIRTRFGNASVAVQSGQPSVNMAHRGKLLVTTSMLWRTLIEFICLTAFGWPMVWIYIGLRGKKEPTRRGFFCDDEALKHPNVEETISVGGCTIMWAAIAMFISIFVECVFSKVHRFQDWEFSMAVRRSSVSEVKMCLNKIPLLALDIYRIVCYYWVGALGSLLTTELAKYKIGRLRPYFLTLCKPKFPNCSTCTVMDDRLCKDDYGFYKFVTMYECTAEDEHEVWEAMKSFLSGHSSFSFYSALFIIIYLQARLSGGVGAHREFRRAKEEVPKARLLYKFLVIICPFLQFGCFGLAWYVALTRIVDYKHHPFDVLVGIMVGSSFAFLTLFYLLNLFTNPRPIWHRQWNWHQSNYITPRSAEETDVVGCAAAMASASPSHIQPAPSDHIPMDAARRPQNVDQPDGQGL